jgi:predicted adenylyl cyclase CyaB
MRNLEQKFRFTDLIAAAETARRLGAAERGVIIQHDYFFAAPHARLKLRCFPDGSGELISYRRPDQSTARSSEYLLFPVPDTESLRVLLTDALGPPRELKKRRTLFLFYATRIHLDEVENLGNFIELETVITNQSDAAAQAELEGVVLALGLSDPVPTAYVDLLSPPR